MVLREPAPGVTARAGFADVPALIMSKSNTKFEESINDLARRIGMKTSDDNDDDDGPTWPSHDWMNQ